MHPLDIPVIAAKGVPIICIDTCSLLDIMRDPTRDDALPHERQAACDLLGALELGDFHCLIADQVATEFTAHVADIEADALRSLAELEARVDRTNRLHAVFAPPVAITLGHLKAQVAAARTIVDRWITASHLAPQSTAAVDRAFNRVLLKTPPSKQGKDSMQDCVVYETYLEAIRSLRALNLPSDVVFLSSNKKEYQSSAIAAELAPLGISYAPNMAAAKAKLGV